MRYGHEGALRSYCHVMCEPSLSMVNVTLAWKRCAHVWVLLAGLKEGEHHFSAALHRRSESNGLQPEAR